MQQRAKQEGVLRMHLKWPGNLILLRNSSRRLEISEFEPGFDRSETSLRLQRSTSQLQMLHEKGEDGALDSVAECDKSNKDHKLINSTISDSIGIKEKLLVNGNKVDTNMDLNICTEALEKVGSSNENTSLELVIDTWHESLRNEIRHATQSTATLSNVTILPRVRRQGICFPVPKVHHTNGSVVDSHDNWLKTPFSEELHVSCASSLNLSDFDCSDSSCEG